MIGYVKQKDFFRCSVSPVFLEYLKKITKRKCLSAKKKLNYVLAVNMSIGIGIGMVHNDVKLPEKQQLSEKKPFNSYGAYKLPDLAVYLNLETKNTRRNLGSYSELAETRTLNLLW